MSEALEQALSSNSETPLETLEFLHSAITGGAIRLVRDENDLTATLETAQQVTFTAAGIDPAFPERAADGRQDLLITVDNVSLFVYQQINQIIEANRVSEEKVICNFRSFLLSNLTAPQEVYTLDVIDAVVTDMSAQIRATYAPITDMRFPAFFYYANKYPGVKYA